jgi:hypothetical protein
VKEYLGKEFFFLEIKVMVLFQIEKLLFYATLAPIKINKLFISNTSKKSLGKGLKFSLFTHYQTRSVAVI